MPVLSPTILAVRLFCGTVRVFSLPPGQEPAGPCVTLDDRARIECEVIERGTPVASGKHGRWFSPEGVEITDRKRCALLDRVPLAVS